jgi:C-1 hydroxylase
MSIEENKANVRRGFEAVNQKNLAVFDELLTPDVVFHSASTTMQGLEAYKQFLSMLFTAFPDLQFTIEDMIQKETPSWFAIRRVVPTRARSEASLPQAKQVSGTGMFIDRIVNSKAVEQWFNGDDLGLLQQLGVIPAPGQPG